MQNPFEDIVGQDQPKKELGFYLQGYLQTRIIPNLMIVAPKGQGKTTLARAVAKGLYQFDEGGSIIEVPSKTEPGVMKMKRKPFIEVNCSSLKTVKQFINDFVIHYIQDKDVTVLFDEASEIPREVTMAMLTILNPNPENRTTFSFGEYTCDFDFRRQTFIFATSEIQKVFHALADRLERITLEEYTDGQLAAIIQKGIPEVECRENVLFNVASVLRGNARAAQKMANKIATYLQGKKLFTPSDWQNVKKVLGIYPLGLNVMEIQILRHLAQHGEGVSLTGLAARTGMTAASLRKDGEMFLQKLNLMGIEGKRMITAKGLEYLRALGDVTGSCSKAVGVTL